MNRRHLVAGLILALLLISPRPVEVFSGTTTVQDFALQACVPMTGADFDWQPQAPVVNEPVLFTGQAWASSEWITETVGGSNSAGQFVSLVVDSAGHPHISYVNDSDHTAYYTYHNGLAWHTEAIDTPAGGSVSLALDSMERPHLAYMGDSSNDLNYAYYDGSSWITMTVTRASGAGEVPSLSLDLSDHPHIAYYEYDNSDLHYASYSGTAWVTETVDSTGQVGPFASLAIDAAGRPHISYADFTRGALDYAYYDGSAWITETVDSQGASCLNTSLVLDADGRPIICYEDCGSNSLKCAHYDGSAWTINTIDYGAYPSLAIDSRGNLHLGYLYGHGGILEYARYNGSTWTKETVDSGIGDWGAVSLDLGPTGLPSISYYDHIQGVVDYAHQEQLLPTFPTYTWSFGNGATASGITATHAYAASGSYLVTMTATNDCTAVPVVVTHTVDVCAPVQGLTLDWTPPAPVAGQVLTLTAGAAGDPPITFTWDFGDGTPPLAGGQGGGVTHTYNTTGAYTVTITASNDCGSVARSFSVTVQPAVYAVYLPIVFRTGAH